MMRYGTLWWSLLRAGVLLMWESIVDVAEPVICKNGNFCMNSKTEGNLKYTHRPQATHDHVVMTTLESCWFKSLLHVLEIKCCKCCNITPELYILVNSSLLNPQSLLTVQVKLDKIQSHFLLFICTDSKGINCSNRTIAQAALLALLKIAQHRKGRHVCEICKMTYGSKSESQQQEILKHCLSDSLSQCQSTTFCAHPSSI